MDSMMDMYWQIPAVTRTYVSSILVISLVVHTKLLPSYWFTFFPDTLWRLPPQLWRLYTAFCITGPTLGILLDTFFVFRYLRELEVGNARFPRKEDLVWYLIFVSGVILVLCNVVISQLFPVYTYLQALIMALAYTGSQDQRGQRASFYIITIPAQLAPYAMLGMNLLYPNGIWTALIQVTGIVAAHLYDFLSRLYPQFRQGPNLIPTPRMLTLLGNMLPSAPPPARPRGGSGLGPLPDSWRTRGPGHRLG